MFTHSFFTMPPHAPQLPALLQIHRAGGPPGGALAKITTDSAFSRGPHVSPTHTEGELAAMTPVARARAVATDRANKEVRKSVESGYVEERREREWCLWCVCVCCAVYTRIRTCDATNRPNTPLFSSLFFRYNVAVTKFRHADCFRKHRLFAGGVNNFPNLAALWDMLILFTNLFTCTMGSQVTSILGVEPPTPAEYLASCNGGHLIDLV